MDVVGILNSDDDFHHPSRYLIPFFNNNENRYFYIVNFGKRYRTWAGPQFLSSFKLKNFENSDSFNGIFAGPYTGRGLLLYGGKIDYVNEYDCN